MRLELIFFYEFDGNKNSKIWKYVEKIQASISAYWKNAKLIGKNVLLTFLCTLLFHYFNEQVV